MEREEKTWSSRIIKDRENNVYTRYKVEKINKEYYYEKEKSFLLDKRGFIVIFRQNFWYMLILLIRHVYQLRKCGRKNRKFR